MPFVSVIAILVFDLALLPGFCILHFVLMFAEHLTSYLLLMILLHILDLSASFLNKVLKCDCIHLQLRRMTDYFAITMDGAGESNWHNAMAAQGKLLGEQQCLAKLDGKLNMHTSAISSTFLPQNPGDKIPDCLSLAQTSMWDRLPSAKASWYSAQCTSGAKSRPLTNRRLSSSSAYSWEKLTSGPLWSEIKEGNCNHPMTNSWKCSNEFSFTPLKSQRLVNNLLWSLKVGEMLHSHCRKQMERAYPQSRFLSRSQSGSAHWTGILWWQNVSWIPWLI